MTPDQRFVAATMARENLYWYSRYMFRATKGYRWLPAAHHPLVCDALMRVYTGHTKRLIINIPPRYSKTVLAVINFISWALGKSPDAEFIHVSYSARLAASNSWSARELVVSPTYREIFPELRLRDDAQARDDWRTTAGGIVYSSGSGGTITGFGAGKMREGFGGAIIADDLHKADEARSDAVRLGVIEWWQNTLESRKNSAHTPIIVIMQRLHQEDIAGWLLGGGNGEDWELLCLPAIQEDDTALWPEKHTLEVLKRMREAAPYTFSGQYQQRPTPTEGATFRPDKITILPGRPPGGRWMRAWDLAATQDDGDWTVGALLGAMPNGRFCIADVIRFQGGPDVVETTILQTAQTDGVAIPISIPQDPGQAGKVQILHYAKKLAGFIFKPSPESGDKVTRSEPFAAQVNLGLVDMVRGEWNSALLNEMRFFPFGKHDDQVDALSRAFGQLIEQNSGSEWLGFLASEVERNKAAAQDKKKVTADVSVFG